MKVILINLVVVLAIVLMYYLGFWTWFSLQNAVWYALGLVVLVLLVGLKVFGSPLKKRK